jgi:hypothetical protein
MIKVLARFTFFLAILTLLLSGFCFLSAFDDDTFASDFYLLGGALGIMASFTAITVMAYIVAKPEEVVNARVSAPVLTQRDNADYFKSLSNDRQSSSPPNK